MSSTRKSEVLYPLGAGLLLYFIFCISGKLYADGDNYTVAIILKEKIRLISDIRLILRS